MADHSDERATPGGKAHASRRERPALVYDGDCAFCTSCARVLERIGPDAEIVAWQLTDLAELGITEADATGAVQWVQSDGAVRSGHEAIAAVLATAGGIWTILGRVLLLPGISWLAGKVYLLVADNRHRLPGSTPACAPPPQASTGEGRHDGRQRGEEEDR
jgi:predicted DCC family thiol-disulfide oxidoreductase YuxK